MDALEQADAAGRWCAVATHLSELGTQAGQIELRSGVWIDSYLDAFSERLRGHLARHKARWPELTDAQVRVLNAIDMDEERGNWGNVRSLVGRPAFRAMENSGTTSLLEHLRGLGSHLAAAELYEREHGRGSLIERDHPSYVYRRKHEAHVAKIRERLRQPAFA